MKKLYFILVLLFTISISYGQWTTTDLPIARSYMAAASSWEGNTFWFAGGYDDLGISKRVDIYHEDNTGYWTSTELSEARAFPIGVAYGGYTIFAGGVNFENQKASSRVDIWSSTEGGSWSTAQLSEARFSLSAEVSDGKVLFAGGADLFESKDVVDIYNIETEVWDTASLSQARSSMGSTVAHNAEGDAIAIFAGGFDLSTLSVTDRVDIYNFTTGAWSVATLSEPRGFLSATTVGKKVLIAGGMKNDNTASDRVDIYDPETGEWTTGSLSVARAFIENAATICGEAFFAGGGVFDLNSQTWITASDVVDIYNADTKSWSVQHLTYSVINHSMASNGKHLLIGGGQGSSGFISNVDIYTCATSAFEEIQTQQAMIAIYPNPSNGIVYISRVKDAHHEALHASIYNMQGGIVTTATLEPGDSELQLDLPLGAYYLKLTGKKGTQSEVIIIQ